MQNKEIKAKIHKSKLYIDRINENSITELIKQE